MDSSIAYEQKACQFLNVRDKSRTGCKVVRDWALNLPKGTEVLEIACGGGYPITTELQQAGLKLWAIDSSETLLSKFRSRFPDILSQCERVQETQFFNKTFDAVIAIGLIFLLSESEQKAFIGKVSEHLESNGSFLFTAPTQTGNWKDLNTGLECVSLGLEKYQELLEECGFEVTAMVVDSGRNNYYEARKL